MGYPYEMYATYAASCRWNEYLFFSNNAVNGLFKVDLNTNAVSFVCLFPDENPLGRFLHFKAFEVRGKIVFVPRYGKCVSVFNPIDSSVISYPLDKNDRTRVNDACLYGNVLWLFYSDYRQGAVALSTEDYSVCGKISYKDSDLKRWSGKENNLFINLFSFEGRYAYGAIGETDCFVRFDLEKNQGECISVKDSTLKACGNTVLGKFIYMISLDSTCVWKYNMDDKTTNLISGCSNEMPTEKRMKYAGIFHCNGEIVLLPESGNIIYGIDEEGKFVKELCRIPNTFLESEKSIYRYWRRFFTVDSEGDKLFVAPFKCNGMLVISPSEKSCQMKEFAWPREYIDRIFEENNLRLYGDEQMKKSYIYESDIFGLKGFLERI